MIVTEIFRSIQGESTHAGLPCIFVRLTGCNLRCVWCDTAYAFYGGTQRTVDEVIAKVHSLADSLDQTSGPIIRLVEITGGEPLLQPETPELARRLLADGFTVLVETSGERPIKVLPPDAIKIVDVKCPNSGEHGTFDLGNLAALSGHDEIKFVIASRRDYEFAREFLAEHKLAGRVRQVLFAPVAPSLEGSSSGPQSSWPGLEALELAEWILADRLPVRMNLQLHKFIWDPAMHGV
jgi:7-carboxy-7-deazaguanine synthase